MNHERRIKHRHRWKDSVVVRGHLIRGDKSRAKHTVGETLMIPVPCPECNHKFRDVGSFIHHMWVFHEWDSTKSLIYWGDNYRAEELEDE